MNVWKTSIGFEVAGTDLRIAVVKSILGKLRFVANYGLSGFVEMDDVQRRASLADLFRKHKIGAGQYTLTLSHDCGNVRQLEFPAEIRDKLKSAIALQVETLSPWNADEIYWDYSVESSKNGAKTLTVSVAIVPRAAVDPWITFFKAAGFPLSAASLSSMTYAHGAATIWQDARPAIILSCLNSSVEGVIVHRKRVASLTIKGEDIRSISKTAVDRLCALGRVQSSDDVRLIVQGSRGVELGADSIAIPIEGARQDASQVFGAWSTAMLALKSSAFRINVVPADQRYRRNQLRLIPTYVLLALTVLLGLVMVFREPYQAMVYASRLDAEIQSISPAIRELSVEEAELNRLSERYRALTNHFQARDRNLDAIRELSRILPQ